MDRKPLSFPITITVSGKTGSGNTSDNTAIANAGGYLRGIYVKPPQDTDTFDFKIIDEDSYPIYKRSDIVGELIEDLNTAMPAGSYTCQIENASRDGVYIAKLKYAEVY